MNTFPTTVTSENLKVKFRKTGEAWTVSWKGGQYAEQLGGVYAARLMGFDPKTRFRRMFLHVARNEDGTASTSLFSDGVYEFSRTEQKDERLKVCSRAYYRVKDGKAERITLVEAAKSL